MKSITSDSNPLFRRWLRISTTPRLARAEGVTIGEGIHLALAAAAAGTRIFAVLLRRGASGGEIEQVLAALAQDTPRYELAPALYDRICGVEQGAGLLLVVPISEPDLPVRSAGDAVYLDGIQDPGNTGAILRSAAAAGVRCVLAGPGTAALWSPRVLRAAMGAHFRLALREQVAPHELPGCLDGRWIAAEAHGASSLWEHEFDRGAVGWIFGGEGAGVGAEALAIASARVRVPTSDAVESLNVAAAAAICLFERLRRR